MTHPWNWFIEYTDPSQAHMYGIKRIVYSGETQFQSVEIADLYFFGRGLILDGKIQSAEYDEYIYHEALIQPAMLMHNSPKDVLVLGGGEGAVLREILRHPSVQKVVMVDIDREVVDLCRKYLPSWNAGSFDDTRVEILFMDARRYIEETSQKFDVIISDLTEPVEEGPSYLLFTREFYRIVAERLSPGGVVAMQAGSFNPKLLEVHAALYNTLQLSFNVVRSYHAFIPSFDSAWGFLLASPQADPCDLKPAEIDELLADRNIDGLSFYDGETHRGIFSLPKYIRQLRNAERRIIADDHPLYIY